MSDDDAGAGACGGGAPAADVSPALAAGILRAALDAVIVIDHASRVVEWNAAAERTFGYPRDEALGRDLAELVIPPDLRAAHRAGVARYLAAGEARLLNRRVEVPALRRDGTVFPAELTVVPVADDPPCFAAHVRDATARKRAEQELRQSQAELEDFFENSPVGLHFMDADGIILRANRAETEMLGYRPEEYVGRPISEFHADADAIADILRRLAAGEELHSYEARMRCKDGSIRHVLVSSNVLFQDGRFVHSRCFTRDITERRVAEAERAEAAAESARQQRRFLRDVLASVTEGRLRLCLDANGLPARLPPVGEQPVWVARDSLREARARATRAARAAGLDREREQDLITAVGEATMNAVSHAGGGHEYAGADPAAGVAQVWVEDRGGGIEMSRIPQATLDRGYSTAGTFGHGFWLMLRTADRVWLLTGPAGTTVVVEKDRDAAEPAWLSRTLAADPARAAVPPP